MNAPARKPKTCPHCESEFIPRTSLQKVCSLPCAIEDGKEKRQKAHNRAVERARRDQRARDRAWKEANTPKSKRLKAAQRAFNAFIRARDHGKTCISCNRHISDVEAFRGHNRDCGHYRSVGAASQLRFNTYNAHAQCVQCNRDYSGNVVDYRINLIRRIGLDRVERLECDNAPREFSHDYLKRVVRLFNRRTRHYKKLRGIE